MRNLFKVFQDWVSDHNTFTADPEDEPVLKEYTVVRATLQDETVVYMTKVFLSPCFWVWLDDYGYVTQFQDHAKRHCDFDSAQNAGIKYVNWNREYQKEQAAKQVVKIEEVE